MEIKDLTVSCLRDKPENLSSWVDVSCYKTISFNVYTTSYLKLEVQYSYKPGWDTEQGPRAIFNLYEKNWTVHSFTPLSLFCRLRIFLPEDAAGSYNDMLIVKFFGAKRRNVPIELASESNAPLVLKEQPKDQVQAKNFFFNKKDQPLFDSRIPSYVPDGSLIYSKGNRFIIIPRGQNGQTLCWVNDHPEWIT